MATFGDIRESLISCPYDKAHRMLPSRLQTHIAKCKLNNLDKEMASCSFNAQHVVPIKDLQHHLSTCEDRILLDKALIRTAQEKQAFQGRTAVPAYNSPVLKSSENWDDEIDPNAAAGYTPRDPALAGLILDLGMTKPAERKKIYKQHVQQVVENKNIPGEESLFVRQPKFSHEAISKSSGIGRGVPVAAQSPKIAANIYANSRQPASSHKEIFSKMVHPPPYVGIGRGKAAPYDNDFPILGSH